MALNLEDITIIDKKIKDILDEREKIITIGRTDLKEQCFRHTRTA